MLAGFTQADFYGVEFYNMGQQAFLGRYPVHYHVVGQVYGSYTRSSSIHNCFSRCVTLHGSEGLVVSVSFQTVINNIRRLTFNYYTQYFLYVARCNT